MGILLEGFGEDWLVARRQGGRPELTRFSSLAELGRAVRRLLLQAETHAPPKETSPQSSLFRGGDYRAPLNGTGRILDLALVPPSVPLSAREIPHEVVTSSDCMSCGACCVADNESQGVHVRLDDPDVQSIPEGLRSGLTVTTDRGQFVRTRRDSPGLAVCAALKGSVGNQCRCSIYEQRPMVCRLFEPGSQECLGARERLSVGML